MPFPWLAAATLGGSVIGGLINKKSTEDTNAENKKFAKNRIQITANDAKKAGIHPLAALGAAGASSYNAIPQSYGTQISDGISRAASVAATGNQQSIAKQVATSEIAVNSAQAELLKAQTFSTLEQVKNAAQNRASSKMPLDNPLGVGTKDNPIKEAIYVEKPNGDTYLTHNPEISVGIEEMGTVLTRRGEGAFYGNPDKKVKMTKSGFPANPARGAKFMNNKGQTFVYHPRHGWRKT